MAVNPTKKRVNISAVAAASNTNPEMLVILPRHLTFAIKPVQHPKIMASKRFTMTIAIKRK